MKPKSMEDAQKRFHELIDRKLAGSLTDKEKRELSRLERSFDKAEASFWNEVKKRDETALRRLNAAIKKLKAARKTSRSNK